MTSSIEPIGTVLSPVSEGRDEDWGEVVAELRIADALPPGLAGIEQFSHFLVLFLTHESKLRRRRSGPGCR